MGWLQESADIIIVGGGTAGLTLSILMAEKGHNTVVIEERTLSSKSNRAVVLQSNGLRVLDKTGLLSRLPAYIPTTATTFFNRQRQQLGLFNYGVIDHPLNYLLPTIPHEVERVLTERALKLGVTIKRGHAFTGFTREVHSVKVKTLTDQGSTEEFQASVLVGADGTSSRVRSQAGIDFRKKKYRDGYLLMLTGKSNIEQGMSSYYLDKGLNMGVYPVSQDKTYVFYYVPFGAFDGLRERGFPSFKQHLVDLAPELKESVRTLESWNDLLYLEPVGVRCNHWVSDNLALVGDAACGINPNAAQGLNLALEGSYCLAGVLEDCFKKNDFSSESLLRYETKRRPVAEAYYRWAEVTASGLSTESWIRAKLVQRITRNLANRPEMMRKFLEFGAGLTHKPPSMIELATLLLS